MSNSILLFFLPSLFFISYTSSSSINTTHKCSAQQTHALLLFKQSLSSINDTWYDDICEDRLGSGYKPIMMNWKTSTDCCDWNGVTCDHATSDVIGLDLSCGMLQGTIHPNTTLFHLPRLQRLNLAFNNFTNSQLPHDIGRLSNSLTHLNISNCLFTGQVPTDISHLHKLVSLDLSSYYNGNYNFLNLEPHVFINLLRNSTVMNQLSLQHVNISLVLPTNLNISSSSLKLLNLCYTGLQGKLPRSIFSLQSLENLDLSWNSLTGHIPSEISLLPKLNNNLSGPMPKVNTSSSIPLRLLDLSEISLFGEIPTSIGHLKSLEYLLLSDCRLNGSLPKSLGNLRYLKRLDLSYNMLSGTLSLFNIPKYDSLDNGPGLQTFQRLTNLTYIDLSHNNFRGDRELDALLSSLPNLDTLILSYSGISITTSNASRYVNLGFRVLSLASCSLKVFPVSIRAMKNLIALDLSNNDIQGHIPDWIGEIGRNQLKVLNIANNSITGSIPNVYEDWSELEGFILNGNELEGKVPTYLNKCQSLKVIDLGNNQLSDTFPSWLGDLPNLQVLVLRSNNFHGAIVTSSKVEFPFQRLQVLDLSHNGFVGQLPRNYFQNFNAMKSVVRDNRKPKYVYMGGIYYSFIVAVKGVDLYFSQLLVDYTILGLSDNKFHGEIPNITGILKSLKVLNLSRNSLTGQIPHALGNLSEIESLDLSWNRLTGEIPQSLADLTFLAILNLSQNHLGGRIPQGRQFDTFSEYSFGSRIKVVIVRTN
ncbi:hypothetical protein M8C21_029105 [Ambrosia artemisiifolia]|uniref:Leucine-rich repeat-containing N-terminal plant-type domain-containing protein n=1 Tax=Ambrosia artemisiifolia TaxID=4212 RepID=A0AAD5C2N0_AMBAR|nr:hypothetical protein M8C21_029105 [Ambrosia artemisiifolia]